MSLIYPPYAGWPVAYRGRYVLSRVSAINKYKLCINESSKIGISFDALVGFSRC